MPIAGPNPISADRVLPAERLSEIAEILAVGLMRLRARKSSPKSADCGEISLDILADQSGPVPNIAGENGS
jgi:hypothetical protein